MKLPAYAKHVSLSALVAGMALHGQQPRPAETVSLSGPAIPRVGLIGYLASERGRPLLKNSGNPFFRALAQRLGLPLSAPPPATPAASQPPSRAPGASALNCGGSSGRLFNLETRTPPGAISQNGPTIDFLPGAGVGGADLIVGSANDLRGTFNALGNSVTGYYVSRAGTDPCAVGFDGGLPFIVDPVTSEALTGSGDSAVEADPARAAVFIVDTRLGLSASALGLFRGSAANLTSSTICPDGTHSGTVARTCWPTAVEVNPRRDGALNVQPQLAVDPRPTAPGTPAGDVYVANTLVTNVGTFIALSACTNSLSTCSVALNINGNDFTPRAPYVRVRPDGGITVTYLNVTEGPPPDFLQIFTIRYVVCTPRGAPLAPTCSAASTVVSETQPIPSRGGTVGEGSLAASNFMISTFPKHEHRQDANGIETYLIWDRCKVQNVFGGGICPDADLKLAASNNNGTSWTLADLDTAAGDQYFPAIRSDGAGMITIAYFTTQADTAKHRAQVVFRQIPPGAATPDAAGAAQVITATPIEPSADFFFGDAYIGSYIGLASRNPGTGRRAYIHFMHNAVEGIYNGVPAPDQNNHVSRFDY